MIHYHDEPPPVPEAELERAAQASEERGHPIPPSYRTYLTERDGGQPVEDEFSFADGGTNRGSLVQEFLGVGESNISNLLHTLNRLRERMLPGILPIANDTGGNLVCLDTREGGDGPVLFWDHEEETDPPSDENLHWVAPDFRTFLEMLVPNDPPPLVQPTTRWRRLFGR